MRYESGLGQIVAIIFLERISFLLQFWSHFSRYDGGMQCKYSRHQSALIWYVEGQSQWICFKGL
jgi:hypothetical protein